MSKSVLQCKEEILFHFDKNEFQSSSITSSRVTIGALVPMTPVQLSLAHATAHESPCFLQVHLFESSSGRTVASDRLKESVQQELQCELMVHLHCEAKLQGGQEVLAAVMLALLVLRKT